MDTIDMGAVLGAGFLLTLVKLVVAFVVAFGLLRALDRLCDFDFKEWLNNANHPAIGIYLGCRILAIAIVLTNLS